MDRFRILKEVSTLRFNLARIIHNMEQSCEELPAALTQSAVDVLLINEMVLTGPTIAQLLRLPYFMISISVPHSFGWKGSSWLTGYRSSTSCVSWLQGLFLEVSALRMRGPIRSALNLRRSHFGLGPVQEIPKVFPCLTHISQLPQCLDFPHKSPPGNFHYAGLFEPPAEAPRVPFPWDRLDGRPIIYACMGTTRNVQPEVFRTIAEGCQGLGMQLVISLGNRFDPGSFADLPGSPLVTRFAPQLELLKIARIAITHSGPNTVFETLQAGKPMIVIPLAYDQPAIAARLKRLHAAIVLPIMRLSPQRIRAAIGTLLRETRYQEAARRLQAQMQSIRGSERAADIIESCLERQTIRERLEEPATSATSTAAPYREASSVLSCFPR